MLVRVDMAGPHAIVQATLPLGLELIHHRFTVQSIEPQAVARKVEVELALAVAKRRTSENALAQRPAISQVKVQADPVLEQRVLGHDAGGFERRHVGHGGGGTDDPSLKRTEDHRVFARAKAEIVSVDYDLARHVRPP